MADELNVAVAGMGGLDVFGGDAPNDKRCRDCEEKDTCPYFMKTEGFVMDYDVALKKSQDGCVWAQEVDVDDNAVITVRYENGAKMTYTECHFTPDYNRHFTLIGDKGRLYGFYNDARNSAAIAIAAAESCETHEAVEIPGFAFESPLS